MTTKYTFFWPGPFSNWNTSPFRYKGVNFNTAEQAMMWEKAMTFADGITAAQILKTDDPKQQKALGREVKGYDDAVWSAIRYEVVKDILRHKFKQHEPSYKALIVTTSTMLVEASPVDTVWGIGLGAGDYRAKDMKHWKGQNLLGKALTEIRIEFENNIDDQLS